MAEAPFAPLDPLAGMTEEDIMALLQRQQLLQPEGGPSGLPDAGLGPVTPNSIAGMPNPTAMPFEPTGPQNAALATRQNLSAAGMPGLGELLSPFVEGGLEYGAIPAKVYVNQLKRADSAIGDLARDPSIANAANVGVQGSAALMAPRAMLGSAAVGVGDALMKDLGGSPFVSSAEAQQKGRGKTKAPPEMGSKEEFEWAQDRLRRSDFANGGDRRNLEGIVNRYRDRMEKDADRERTLTEQKKRGEQEEYDRRVQGAEAARDKARDKDWSFDDTYFGDFYRKVGGAAPFIAATGVGAAGRLAHGAGKSALTKYGVPYAEGVAGAASASYLPDLTNAYFTPAENMRRRSLEEYGRELPEGHPRKQESLDAASKMDRVNPARKAAQESLENPNVHLGRAGMALLEGTGGPIGAGLMSAPGRVGRDIAEKGLLGSKERAAGALKSQGATPLATGPAGPHAALPGPQTVAKPVMAQKPGEITVNIAAAQQAAKAHREAMAKHRGDPDVAAFFEENKGLGPRQMAAAFSERFGPLRGKSVAKLQDQIGKDSVAKGLADAKVQLAQVRQGAQGEAAMIWGDIAKGGNASKRAILQIMPELKQGIPGLANLPDEQVIRIILSAAKSAP